jgi:hypothetical protein
MNLGNLSVNASTEEHLRGFDKSTSGNGCSKQSLIFLEMKARLKRSFSTVLERVAFFIVNKI